VHVRHVDLLELAPRWVRAFYGPGYELVAERAPRLWGGIYRATDGPEADPARWAPLAERTLFRAFQRLLRERPWNACLCTHFLPCQVAAGRPGLPPFALAVTDFTLHRVWVQRGVGRYFVATEALAAELSARAPRARVEATGIPIAPPRPTALPDPAPGRPLALVLGGGLGIGVEDAVRAALEGTPPAVQVVAVCGRNEAARRRLEAHGVAPERLRVLGYVDGLAGWMARADLVATKPGGLTLSEGLAMGKPLLLTRPIPGAEEGNLRTVAALGAALAGRTFEEARSAFARAFAEPGLLPRLSAAAAALGRADAAARVADAVAPAAAARVAA
jgi:processive 1,2-diacylglycerol beta-glucosyltransferase